MTFQSVKCAPGCPGGFTAAASQVKCFEGSLARWGGGHLPPPTQPWAGVDRRQRQGRGCMMTVVVTISSSSVASITPRSTLLDTIILRTALMVKTEGRSPARHNNPSGQSSPGNAGRHNNAADGCVGRERGEDEEGGGGGGI